MTDTHGFDAVISRTGTGSLKYDFAMRRAGRTDLLPLWVADMDFALPEPVLERIHARVSHGIFGYTEPDDSYYDTLERWFLRRYGWKIDRSWNTVTPGVVYAISCAVRAFTGPGDVVLIQEPVYYPFREMIECAGRRCVSSTLINHSGRYEMDFGDLEKKLSGTGAGLMLLCSPHNPVGRVWSEDELRRLAGICARHKVIVAADEIHCDFIYSGNTFVPFGRIMEEEKCSGIIMTSASKSFNLAGLQAANILIPDGRLRQKFRMANEGAGYSQANTLGLTATKAAYDLGEDWLDSLREYLEETVRMADSFIRSRIPEVHLVWPEGTYLLWMDFSGLTRREGELHRLIRDGAHLWLDDGSIFGDSGRLFERMNIACPRQVVRTAFENLETAVRSFRER